MSVDVIPITNNYGHIVACLDFTPLGKALAGSSALVSRSRIGTLGGIKDDLIRISLDGIQVDDSRQRIITIESLGANAIVSPVLNGNGVCHACWTLRRLAVWAATNPVMDNPVKMLTEFRSAVNPLHASWTSFQIDSVSQRLLLKLDSTENTDRLLQAEIIEPNGTLYLETILPRPDCPYCCKCLQTSRIGQLDQQQKLATLTGTVAGLIVGLDELPPLPDEPSLPYVYHGCLANTWITVDPGNHYQISGKGWTAEDARIRTLGEAVERYCASFVPVERLVAGIAGSLPGKAIPPGAFHGLTRTQAKKLNFATDNDPVYWIAVEQSSGGESIFVPADAVYTRTHPSSYRTSMPRTTNGIACAPSLDAALCGARRELIERDRFFAAWYGLNRTTKISDSILTEEAAILALHQFRTAGIEISFLHCGSENGLEIVAACGRNLKPSSLRPAFSLGLGISTSLANAANSAFLEMGQVYRGLTYTLQDPVYQERAKQLALCPEMSNNPVDHALFYCASKLSPIDHFIIVNQGSSLKTTADQSRIDPNESMLTIELTTIDISALLSWHVIRAISPIRIPYHVSFAQIPKKKLPPAIASFTQYLHPLC